MLNMVRLVVYRSTASDRSNEVDSVGNTIDSDITDSNTIDFYVDVPPKT